MLSSLGVSLQLGELSSQLLRCLIEKRLASSTRTCVAVVTCPWQNHFWPLSIRPGKIQFSTSARYFWSRVCTFPDSEGFSANSPLCVRGLSRAPMSYLSTFSRTTFSIFGMGSFVCRHGAGRRSRDIADPIHHCQGTQWCLPRKKGVQGWAKKWSPGCEIIRGKWRQK